MSIHSQNAAFGSPKSDIRIDPIITHLEICLKELLSARIDVQTVSLKHYFGEQKTRNNLHIHK